MKQGQGASTIRKEQGFRQLFCDSLRLASAPTISRYPFWHIDLNAGSGHNDLVGCDGSPVAFGQEAMGAGRFYRSFLVDRDFESIASLRQTMVAVPMPDDSTRAFLACDNAEALPAIASRIRSQENPAYAVGLVLCDPNGWKGVPFDALAAFAAEFPRIDIVLHLNCNLFRSVAGCKLSRHEHIREGFADWPSPEEVVARLCRPNWLIRNVSRAAGHNFTTLLGRTSSQGIRQFADFFPLSSLTGRQILTTLRRVDGTDQLRLFPEDGQ